MSEQNEMNEEKLAMVLGKTVSGISASPELRARALSIPERSRHTPVRMRRFAFVSTAAAVFVAIGFFGMRPRESSASAIVRFQNAISNIDNMYVQTFSHWNGKTRVGNEQYYRDGRWMYGDHFPRTGPVRWSLVKGDRHYEWYEGSRVATSEPWDSSGASPNMTALEYVKKYAGIGGDPKFYSARTEAHENVDGKPAYMIIVDQKPQPNADPRYLSHAEILVDKQTDLPLSMIQRYPAGSGSIWYNEFKYQFNLPLAKDFFEPCNGRAAKIRDLPAERNALLDKWRTPLAIAKLNGQSCEVREVDVNPDGTITMIYSTAMPIEGEKTLAPTSLTDSSGTTYVRIPDQMPGAITSDETTLAKTLRLDDHVMAICVWVPLEPRKATPSALKVAFQQRTFEEEPQDNLGAHDQSGDTASVDVRATPTGKRFPDWSVPLHMQYIQVQQPTQENHARAAYYESKKKYVDAARWYGSAYSEEVKSFRSIAYHWLESEATCLEKAGKKQEALALKKKALQARSVDPNLSDAERAATKKDLDALNSRA